MEELKLLVQMVASLPTLAVWVVVAFYAYKVAIVGSIYGVIRYCVNKAHDWAITRKTLPPVEQELRLADRLYGIVITSDDTLQELMHQVGRVRGKNISESVGTRYIHRQSVDWLREAIDAKEQQDKTTG